MNLGKILDGVGDVAEAVTDVLGKDEPSQGTPAATAPTPVVEKAKDAAASWLGGFAGVLLIVGSLIADPTFSKALGEFTIRVAQGDGGLGAFVSLLGVGLLAYRRGRPV